MRALLLLGLAGVWLGIAPLALGFEGREFTFGFLPLIDEEEDALRTEVQLSSETGARVTINPTADISWGYPAGTPFVVSLDQGFGFIALQEGI